MSVYFKNKIKILPLMTIGIHLNISLKILTSHLAELTVNSSINSSRINIKFSLNRNKISRENLNQTEAKSDEI